MKGAAVQVGGDADGAETGSAPNKPGLPLEAAPGPGLAACDELASLLLNVRAGCRPSFARLYTLTSATLFGVVLRINRDRAEAEDVLQECFVKVWHRCEQFDPARGKAIHWLVGIARHNALDSLRRRDRCLNAAVCNDGEAGDYDGVASNWHGPAETLLHRRTWGALHRVLAGLSHQQRELLLLSFFDDLSHSDIAHRLGQPLGSVKSSLRRCLMAMRPRLADHH